MKSVHSAGSAVIGTPSQLNPLFARTGTHLFRALRVCSAKLLAAGALLVGGVWGLLAVTGSLPGGRLLAGEADRIEVGEISAYGGTVKVRHAFSEVEDSLQSGGKIYVGDDIETAADGTLEILLGLNARLRLAGSTAVRVNSRTATVRQEGDIARETTRVEVLLRKGELRARVKENLVTPTLLAVVAANMQLTLPRSDCLVRRNDAGAEDARRINLLLGWGRCGLNVKGDGEKDWLSDGGMELAAPGLAVIPELPGLGYLPRWEKTGTDDADKALQRLPFSADDSGQEPQKKAVRNPELDGA